MPQDWKRFQELVGRIERVAAPNGAVVKSPDHIPDLVTGALREVDASVRYRIGTAHMLVTIEARRRKDREDVTWIEQLASKRENIGAHATIAVSSKGFSSGAASLARRNSILLRIVSDLDRDSLERLFAPVVHVRPKVEFLKWGADTHGESKLHALSPHLVERLDERGPEAKIFLHRPTKSPSSLMDLVRFHQQNRGLELFDEVPPGGGKRNKSLEIVFPDPMTLTTVNDVGVEVSLKRVYLTLGLWREDTLVLPDIAVQYQPPSGEESIGHSEFQVGEGEDMTRLMVQTGPSGARFAVDILNERGDQEPAELELIRRVQPSERRSRAEDDS